MTRSVDKKQVTGTQVPHKLAVCFVIKYVMRSLKLSHVEQLVQQKTNALLHNKKGSLPL